MSVPPLRSCKTWQVGDHAWLKGELDYNADRSAFIPWVKGKIQSLSTGTCSSSCSQIESRNCPWVTIEYLQPVLDRQCRGLDPVHRKAQQTEIKQSGGYIKRHKQTKLCSLWHQVPSQVERVAQSPNQIKATPSLPPLDPFAPEPKLLELEKQIRRWVYETELEQASEQPNPQKIDLLETQCEIAIEIAEQFAWHYQIKIDGSQDFWILHPSVPWCNLVPDYKGMILQTVKDHRKVVTSGLQFQYQPTNPLPHQLRFDIAAQVEDQHYHFSPQDLVALPPIVPYSKLMEPSTQFLQLSLFECEGNPALKTSKRRRKQRS